MIENTLLNAIEKDWLEKMLSADFSQKENVIAQINCAEIFREYTDYYISLLFKVDKNSTQKIQTKERVLLEMRAFKPGQPPVQYLLHILNGYVAELELFYADSSKIIHEITLEDAETEVLVY